MGSTQSIEALAAKHLRRGIATRRPEDEMIVHPLDCYDDEAATPAIRRINELHIMGASAAEMDAVEQEAVANANQ